MLPSVYDPGFETVEHLFPQDSRGGRALPSELMSEDGWLDYLIIEASAAVKRASARELYQACLEEGIGIHCAVGLWRRYKSKLERETAEALKMRNTPRLREEWKRDYRALNDPQMDLF